MSSATTSAAAGHDPRTCVLLEAPQGAGRLKWPLLANFARLVVAAGGGWLALRWGGNLTLVFLAQSAALAAFGLITAAAVRGGAWTPRAR